jgi:tetratricopeptide (TPR) repeat protein
MIRNILPAVAFFTVTTATIAAQTTDYGAVDFPTSGSASAQSHFLRGLALLHDFEYAQAATSFREAQKLDPGSAIAYWGEAMTYNHPVWMEQDSAAARAVLARLGATPQARLEKAPTPRERAYLQAVEALYGAGDKKARDFAYRDAMQRVMQEYPDDEDAASFYALALLGTTHDGRHVPTYMRAAAIAEDVFRAHPRHPGAVHYLIHSYDDPVHAPLGLRAARAYSVIAPKAGHAQHMTSHIFVAMGMWTDVVKANELAMEVVNTNRHSHGQGPAACGHYNLWLEYGYLMQDRKRDARRLLDECRSAVTAGNNPGGAYVIMRARWLLDTEDWNGDVARETFSAQMLPPVAHLNQFLDAYTAAKRGERERAMEQLAKMRTARQASASTGPVDPSTLAIMEILETQIEALLLSAERKHDQATQLMRRAAERESSLPYEFGPPFVVKPSHELLGELLLAAGKPSDAVTAFEQALAQAPLRANALRGLASAAEQAGLTARASETRKQLASIQVRPR